MRELAAGQLSNMLEDVQQQRIKGSSQTNQVSLRADMDCPYFFFDFHRDLLLLEVERL